MINLPHESMVGHEPPMNQVRSNDMVHYMDRPQAGLPQQHEQASEDGVDVSVCGMCIGM